MNSKQPHRDDRYLTAQIRLDAHRAWRKARSPLRMSVTREQSHGRARNGAIPRGHLPRGALVA
jgi:hypothetical protein